MRCPSPRRWWRWRQPASFARQIIRPRLNALRDGAQAGDPEAKRQFDSLHRTSVILNAAQALLLAAALILLALV